MRFLTVIMAFVLWAGAAIAQAADPIEDAISNQMEAFNAREVDEAWQYAAPNIQRMFGNARNFGAMVQQGYPMVWDNSDVAFLDRKAQGGIEYQIVRLRDRMGNFHMLEYSMMETSQGWRIAGVRLIPMPDVGA